AFDRYRVTELFMENTILSAMAELNDDAYIRLKNLIGMLGGLIAFAIQASMAAATAAKDRDRHATWRDRGREEGRRVDTWKSQVSVRPSRGRRVADQNLCAGICGDGH
ncbi:MAG: hypothetical protein ACREQB_04625, partial [Candidatus Binataceae bacterium]